MAFGGDRTVKVALTANVTDYLGKMSAAAKATSDFASAASSNAESNAKDWKEVGKSLLAVGAASALGVGLSTKAFAEFDAAMSAAAAGTNATSLELKSLREAAIKAGADTQYSATEAANAITEMGKAGVSTQDILSGGLIGALNLAAAGQLEVARAGEIASVAMNQFGLSGKDIPHIADVLSAGAGKAMGSVEDLGTAFEQVAPIAASMGFSLEETTGVLAEFAQAGLKGEKGGTGFRSVLLSLTAPSKQAREEIDRLGISIYDSQGKTRSAAALAGQLSKALGTQTEADKNAALGRIFGNEAMAAATVLYKGGSAAVQDWTKKVNDSGFAARQAAQLTDNLKGDMERLSGSIDTVLIQGGSGSNAPLRALVKGLQSVVDGFGNLGPAGSQAAFGFTALTAGVTLTTGAAMVAVPKIIELRASLTALQVSATNAGAAVGYATAALVKVVAIAGVAQAATVLGSYIGQAQVASETTDNLALSLGSLGSAEVQGSLANLFRLKDGLLTSGEQFVSTAEVIKRFGDNADAALGSSLNMKIGRVQDFGESVAVFNKRVTSLDGALADMVRSGNAEGAKESLNRLMAGVKPELVDQVRGKFTQFNDAIAQAAATGAATTKQVAPLAKSVGDLGDSLGSAIGDANSLGSAMLIVGNGAKTTDDAVKSLAKTIQGDMDAAAKAFASDFDVLGKYDPQQAANKTKAAQESVKAAEQSLADLREQLGAKGQVSLRESQSLRNAQARVETASAKTRGKAEQSLADLRARLAQKDNLSVRDSQRLRDAQAKVDEARAAASKARAAEGAAGLEQSYRDSVKAAQTFTKDIAEVTRRGLDPQVVSKLLQEGPEKAAPALEALLGKHSAQMIQMVNDGEASLSKINQSIVEQQRLTSVALNSSTDQLSADLGTAMRIAQVKAAHGGRITAEALAKELKLKIPVIQGIAAEFGIAIDSAPKPKPIEIKADTTGALLNIGALQGVVDSLTGKTIHIYALEHIQQVRDSGDVARANAMTTANAYATGSVFRDPVHKAGGGPISGPGTGTSDSIPAYLSNGEYVIKAASVAKYGSHFFDRLNSMRFASGGFVGSPAASVSTHTETNNAPVYIDKVMGVTIADVEAEAERRRRTAALRGL